MAGSVTECVGCFQLMPLSQCYHVLLRLTTTINTTSQIFMVFKVVVLYISLLLFCSFAQVQFPNEYVILKIFIHI